MKIAVAGATGTVGEYVARSVRDRGHHVVPLSPRTRVDLFAGRGIEEVLSGVETVIDVTNKTTLSASAARRFFETVTRRLLAAELRGCGA
ncbi:NAD-dependent epimerase/dehydratase family protein [Cellulosimicrobium sp. NPDC055967]|uniref:NAD-dependent epimerase/dehydratase family protein n=1 Tax=Cellulosimicrobium sp. NPDC055967 TaxID=3345670 RepID=UPI0035E10C48